MRDECIGIPPRFECELCPSKFRRKYHLVRHMSARHGINPPIGMNSSNGSISTQSTIGTPLPNSAFSLESISKIQDLTTQSPSANNMPRNENLESTNVMNNFSVDAIMMKNDNFEDVLSPKYKVFDDLRQKLGLHFSPETLLKYRQIKF